MERTFEVLALVASFQAVFLLTAACVASVIGLRHLHGVTSAVRRERERILVQNVSDILGGPED